jgi:capsular exopolysaccharide synthesis family protein
MQRGAIENLYFIPGGNSVPNASELISNGRFKLLLERLTPLFDWVIIDSPPCIAMSDASLMAEFCDGVLVVVAAGKTPFDLAQKTREQLKKFRMLGVVLNKVDLQHAGGHYYYGHYRGSESKGKKKGS